VDLLIVLLALRSLRLRGVGAVWLLGIYTCNLGVDNWVNVLLNVRLFVVQDAIDIHL
jgi:hypothetical protein